MEAARRKIYAQELPLAIRRSAWILFQHELCREDPATQQPFTPQQALVNVLTWMAGQKLTPMERRVVRLLVEGLTQKAIARELGVARDTVKHHIADIRRKLKVESTYQVMYLAGKRGWVNAPKLDSFS